MKDGEFYTPKQVVKLMVEILRPEEGQTVYDPACGSGGMLLEVTHFMERNGLNPKSLTLFGQAYSYGSDLQRDQNIF